MCSKQFFCTAALTIGAFLAKLVAKKFKCAVMCALWSCPGKALNGFPAIASICSSDGSFGAGCSGLFKIKSISFTPNASYMFLYTSY